MYLGTGFQRWHHYIGSALVGAKSAAGGYMKRARTVLQHILFAAALVLPHGALADEGGVSFWVPGFFGSLAAAPQQPGFSLATIYYHTSVTAGADIAIARQIDRGNITIPIKANVNINLKADADLGMMIPSYVFATPVLGGQAAVAMVVPFGRNTASVNATVIGQGPLGLEFGAGRTDTASGFGDLIPQASLRWNFGVDNIMVYMTGNIPVGLYDAKSLANLGIGHGAIDWGAGYTYLNPQTGREFSAVGGFTYNFENTHTNYQNGIDFHLDWGASQFLSKQVMVGLVGYAYQQLTGDSGSGDRMGPFKSRVFGIGPQIGYLFPVSDSLQGYLNLKGYKEFAAEHRPEGWNTWLTLSISPAAKATAVTPRPMITK